MKYLRKVTAYCVGNKLYRTKQAAQKYAEHKRRKW